MFVFVFPVFVLVSMFLSQAWPPQNAVRELASRLKSRAKHGEKNIFLAVDLRKFALFCLLL